MAQQQQQKCVTNAKYVFEKLIFLLAPAKKGSKSILCGVWQLGIFFFLALVIMKIFHIQLNKGHI